MAGEAKRDGISGDFDAGDWLVNLQEGELRFRLIAGAPVLSGLCGWGISYGFEAALAVATAAAQ